MRKILVLSLMSVIGGGLLLVGGCGDKKKSKPAPAPAPEATTMSLAVPVPNESEWTGGTYAAAQAIPETLNPEWEVVETAGKSSYLLHHETQSALREAPAVSAAAEIDADLVAVNAQPTPGRPMNVDDVINAGLGHTGDSPLALDAIEGPEIGRDMDAPRTSYRQPLRALPVAKTSRLAADDAGPELGWLTPSSPLAHY